VIESSIENSVPLSVKPFPAVNVPAPENWVNDSASVPIVAGLRVCTQPVFAYVPEVTKIKSPLSTSVAVSKSVARSA
jgi:hypothetical protein